MRRGGLLMIIAGWLLLAGLIWWAMDSQLARRENPNAALAQVDGARAEVRLQRGRDGHYRAPGRINGHAVDFLVDTGATQVAIPEHVARIIGLQPGRAYQAQTAAGIVLAHATRIGQLQLGGLEARDVAGAILANPGSEEILLGMSFLSRFDIVIREGEMWIRAR
jgi:aspartyl protease family protein